LSSALASTFMLDVAVTRARARIARRRCLRLGSLRDPIFIQICLCDPGLTQKRPLTTYCPEDRTCVSSLVWCAPGRAYRSPAGPAASVGPPSAFAPGLPERLNGVPLALRRTRKADTTHVSAPCLSERWISDSRGVRAFTASRTIHAGRPHVCVNATQCGSRRAA